MQPKTIISAYKSLFSFLLSILKDKLCQIQEQKRKLNTLSLKLMLYEIAENIIDFLSFSFTSVKEQIKRTK